MLFCQDQGMVVYLCIFSVPVPWNSSPTAHHNDAILHSPKQPLEVPCTPKCQVWLA